ncbi:DUF3460 family protein [Noviherbaspirillum massiliense]|uniref:DUF3460 family protein n=1 Tax=Noviherbaspirillum massiliense TaxID=1465823 RepID=UPI0003072E47|nr:DUF3460 family protein [Noviherbaspirillum massiliense]
MKLSKQQGYESDFTKFLKDLKEKNPDIERKQREGRAIWWDRPPLDLDSRRRLKESSVKQQAYVYQTKV